MNRQNIFSAEILPLAPKVDDVELDVFHRKLLDYLRRLTGKLGTYAGGDGGSSTAALKVFAAYKDDQTLSSDEEIVLWENELRRDSIYTYNGTYGFVQVSEAGLYIVECDLSMVKDFAQDYLVIKCDATGTRTDTMTYNTTRPNLDSEATTCSFMVPVLCDANDRLAVLISGDPGIVSDIIKGNSSRLLITKVEAEA